MSLNVNGLKNIERRCKLIDHYIYPVNKNKQPDVFCLQECGTSAEDEQWVLHDFQYDLCFAHMTDIRGKGLITGFHRNLDYCVHDHIN